MLLKAPFRLPTGWLRYYGYPGPRRYVALFWTSAGDEACFNDGQTSATGLSDNWLYLDLVRRPDVAAWLDENNIHLGNSEQEAEHWLIVDRDTNEVFAAARTDARMWVGFQTLPEPS